MPHQDRIKSKRSKIRKGIEGDFSTSVAELKTRIVKHYQTEEAKRYVRGFDLLPLMSKPCFRVMKFELSTTTLSYTPDECLVDGD